MDGKKEEGEQIVIKQLKEEKKQNKTTQATKKMTSREKGIQQNNKGEFLEYRLKRLLFAMGYLSKKGVVIKTAPNEQADIITDIDVYGVYVHKNFTSNTIWADCKSGKDKPLERMSWLIGVRDNLKIDDIIYVKRGVKLPTCEYARAKGVQVLDLDILNRIEKNYGISEDDWRGPWNISVQSEQLKVFKDINILNQDTFKKVASFITTNYWAFDEYTKVKKTITALKQLSVIDKTLLNQEQYRAVRWAIYELVTLLVLAMLNICKEIYYFSDADRKTVISNGLISGAVPVQKREEIVEATYRVAYSIMQKQFPAYEGFLDLPRIGIQPPSYFESFYDMICRMLNYPLEYFDILRVLDFTLMEYDLQDKPIDMDMLQEMFSNYKELKISSKTILHFICNITGISKDVFQLIS